MNDYIKFFVGVIIFGIAIQFVGLI